jgi:aldehyde:ferredoxin oxidoreductase
MNLRVPGNVGSTGEAEPKFLKAVTGKNFSFLDGIEVGKKIWNLDHAIWTLQGRHRDMARFADFVPLDKDGVEEFKTRFYTLQGWNTETGFPTRSTLADMELEHVADELEVQGKLGA